MKPTLLCPATEERDKGSVSIDNGSLVWSCTDKEGKPVFKAGGVV